MPSSRASSMRPAASSPRPCSAALRAADRIMSRPISSCTGPSWIDSATLRRTSLSACIVRRESSRARRRRGRFRGPEQADHDRGRQRGQDEDRLVEGDQAGVERGVAPQHRPQHEGRRPDGSDRQAPPLALEVGVGGDQEEGGEADCADARRARRARGRAAGRSRRPRPWDWPPCRARGARPRAPRSTRARRRPARWRPPPGAGSRPSPRPRERQSRPRGGRSRTPRSGVPTRWERAASSDEPVPDPHRAQLERHEGCARGVDRPVDRLPWRPSTNVWWYSSVAA